MEKLLFVIIIISGIGICWYFLQNKPLRQRFTAFKSLATQNRIFEQKPLKPDHTLQENKVIVLFLHAKENRVFDGLNLQYVFQQANLYYGDKKIYHYYKNQQPVGENFFSVASSKEPGTFEIGNMPHYTTSGLTLFLVLLPNKKVLEAYNAMIDTAKFLAKALEARLEDGEKMPLTENRIAFYRDKIKTLEWDCLC